MGIKGWSQQKQFPWKQLVLGAQPILETGFVLQSGHKSHGDQQRNTLPIQGADWYRLARFLPFSSSLLSSLCGGYLGLGGRLCNIAGGGVCGPSAILKLPLAPPVNCPLSVARATLLTWAWGCSPELSHFSPFPGGSLLPFPWSLS